MLRAQRRISALLGWHVCTRYLCERMRLLKSGDDECKRDDDEWLHDDAELRVMSDAERWCVVWCSAGVPPAVALVWSC